MSKTSFQFKQFAVCHDRCAMKVGTDGVLLGAWVDVQNASKALDVGTGSGLIALMLAQRNSSMLIDAIDINNDAIIQTIDNVTQSPFSARIKSFHLSLQDFAEVSDAKFDLIVSNPPFFTDSLKSPDSSRTLARHTDSLLVEELVRISSSLLSDNGKLSVIYPFEYKESLLYCNDQNNLFVSRITNVYPTLKSTFPKRILVEFSKQEIGAIENDLHIEEARHLYTEEFKGLVKDFYLKL